MLLPENFGLMGLHARDKLAAQERDGDGPAAGIPRAGWRSDASRCTSSAAACRSRADDPARVRQTLLVYGPDGARVARYDKIHLFRFTHGDEDYDEAKTIVAGSEPASVRRTVRRVGLSICYDLRFPELYRALGDWR